MLLALLALAHAAGLATAVAALMSIRTAQGTVAWILALVAFPYFAVPAYWVLGRRRFEGYMVARRHEDSRIQRALLEKSTGIHPFRVPIPDERGGIRAVEGLARMPVLGGNETELLIDGEAIFDSLFAGIDRAEDYLLVQFYIVKDDVIGRELARRLIAKAEAGVRVYVLYDEVGSFRLPGAYLEELRRGGVHARQFHSTRGPGNRFQLNFRNHRKVMVVDGVEGWLGGINVGDEYLGRDPDLGPMRETHLRVRGPAVLGMQLSFLEDWNWATDEIPELSWDAVPAESGRDVPVLVLPTGPADELETGSLMVQHAIHSAVQRIWISSPYFVPDGGVMAALKLAALRGVDTRILVPDRPDHRIVGLAAESFISQLLPAGVRFFRFQPSFLHGKSLLLDDEVAAVGTLNLDNRSFRLNFEITALVLDRDFAGEVAAMFEADFARSSEMAEHEMLARPLRRRMASRAAALFGPIL